MYPHCGNAHTHKVLGAVFSSAGLGVFRIEGLTSQTVTLTLGSFALTTNRKSEHVLNGTVNVADLDIEGGKIIAETDNIAGYTMYTVQHLHKDEIKIISVHEHEIEVDPASEFIPRAAAQFGLGDTVQLKAPLQIVGIITGVVFSVSGCCEYEVMYDTALGMTKKIVAAPLLDKIGTAAEVGTETGSMIRSFTTRT